MQLICDGYEEKSKLRSVRRIAATLLLLTFSIALITPLLSASDPESKLPPCCRRNGKHHCAAMGSTEPSSVPTLQASRCASYPMAIVVAATPLVSLPIVSLASIAAPIHHPAIRPQAQSLCRSSFGRTRQKRGPPLVS